MVEKMGTFIFRFFVIAAFIMVPVNSIDAAPPDPLVMELWSGGVIYYRYCQDDPNCSNTYDIDGSEPMPGTAGAAGAGRQKTIREMMNEWERALTITDPYSGTQVKYVQFIRCTNNCQIPGTILIRLNKREEDGNMCHYFDPKEKLERNREKLGRDPAGVNVFHLGTTSGRILLHELGHCLGLWHEFNREDADRWLEENPNRDGDAFADAFGTRADLIPVLGNYDYDSIMHYGSGNIKGAPDFHDYFGNTIDKDTQGAYISPRDRSRILQYYAHEKYPGWGFFTSLKVPQDSPDGLPSPYLAGGVELVGTPAIAFQSAGQYALFARGSNNHLYWQNYRLVNNTTVIDTWADIGCCFSSDPAAVSRASGRYDVAAVSTGGDVQRLKYIEGVWNELYTIRGGPPSGGIKKDARGNYLGPAIASRGSDLLDVFVVRSDGLLAVSTWRSESWGQWQTLGSNYQVTARPAAVTLSEMDVQIAINEGDVNLYEPEVSFRWDAPTFSMGRWRATTAYQAAPAIARRGGQEARYRVLIVNSQGTISHRTEGGSWRDIGGIPLIGTGISAVATGDFSFKAMMNGETATGCNKSCPNAKRSGEVIQPGGLWIRDFQ